MCIIIIKQEGKKVPHEVIKTSARINPHGLGIVWLDTFEVTYHKSTEYGVMFTDRPYIAHFRYATIGAVNVDNTHPFRCGNNRNEWLMMNGTIKDLGNAKMSDSWVLANKLGRIERHHWGRELQAYDCRFVTINTRNRTFQIYNKELWTRRDGVWYSKDNVFEDTLIAVYGTLKKNYSNYYRYLTSSKFIGHGVTQREFPLVINGLPYMIDDEGKGYNVEVDIFKVSDSVLADLDRLEGHPNWYRRRQIPIVIKGKVVSCWVYFSLSENTIGKTLHRTYIQTDNRWDGYYIDDIWDDDEIVDNPHRCIDCDGELEYDGFSDYYCKECEEWYSINEVDSFS